MQNNISSKNPKNYILDNFFREIPICDTKFVSA